jgi:hypothetical protein
LQLEAYTAPGGKTLALKMVDYKVAIEQAVAVAFAQALAGAETHYNADACFAWVNAGGCIYTTTHPDDVYPNCSGDNIGSFECTAASVSAGQIQEIDAWASVSTTRSRFGLLTSLDPAAVSVDGLQHVICFGAVAETALDLETVDSCLDQ